MLGQLSPVGIQASAYYWTQVANTRHLRQRDNCSWAAY